MALGGPAGISPSGLRPLHILRAHETASYLVQTGRMSGDRLVYPCAGAVVSLFRGYEAGYTGLIPPYVVLTEPQGRFSEAGFLGGRYKPFATGGDPGQVKFVVEGVVAQDQRPAGDQRVADIRAGMHHDGAVHRHRVDRGPRSALAVLLIAPRAGDAGDYRITFDVTHCTGGVGCGRQSFRLKVKRAL